MRWQEIPPGTVTTVTVRTYVELKVQDGVVIDVSFDSSEVLDEMMTESVDDEWWEIPTTDERRENVGPAKTAVLFFDRAMLSGRVHRAFMS
jgi:hypothetical protein